MSHSNNGVVDLALERMRRQLPPDLWGQSARAFADLMCVRLAEMYSSKCSLEHLEKIERLKYRVRYSVTWKGKPLHRGMVLQLNEQGNVDTYAVEEK